MELNNILRLRTDNLAGSSKIYIIPSHHILDEPIEIAQVMDGNFTLDTDKYWLKVEGVLQSIEANTDNNQTETGATYKHRTSIIIAGDGDQIADQLRQWAELRWVVLREEYNATTKLCGRMDQPLKLSWKHVSPSTIGNRRGYLLEFTADNSEPELFYTGDITVGGGSVVAVGQPAAPAPVTVAAHSIMSHNDVQQVGGLSDMQVIAYNIATSKFENRAITFTETDPIFLASAASGITGSNITNWNSAYSWGNHAIAGYLTAETDPIFLASAAFGITGSNITNWNSAYSWGNHAIAGYVSGSGSVGHLAFFSGTSTLSEDATNLHWDNTNKVMAIGGAVTTTNRLKLWGLSSGSGSHILALVDSGGNSRHSVRDDGLVVYNTSSSFTGAQMSLQSNGTNRFLFNITTAGSVAYFDINSGSGSWRMTCSGGIATMTGSAQLVSNMDLYMASGKRIRAGEIATNGNGVVAMALFENFANTNGRVRIGSSAWVTINGSNTSEAGFEITHSPTFPSNVNVRGAGVVISQTITGAASTTITDVVGLYGRWVFTPGASGAFTNKWLIDLGTNSAGSLFKVSDVGDLYLVADKTININGTQVLKSRKTGYSNMTGTTTRNVSSKDTSTITTAELAQVVKALLTDLGTSHHGILDS